MSNTTKVSQKPKKTVKNVMVQPYDVIWPIIAGEHFEELSRQLERVDRQFVVTGCESVIKLLQNGQAAAFFIQDSFHPKVFAKIIIKMARKRNPSVLAVAVPSLPTQLQSTSMMMAIIHQKTEDQSPDTRITLCWIKKTLLQKGYVTAKELRRQTILRRTAKRAVEKRDKPMTNEEIANMYVLEPISGLSGVDHLKTTGSITLSDSAQIGTEPILIDRKTIKKCTYLPLRVNKVQGNMNRVEHKKKNIRILPQNKPK
uniref:Uncharacterized protein n=1 Tax=Anopheles atroparvus TaxID=41427 RepID=A0AAG5CUE3_ANOAO